MAPGWSSKTLNNPTRERAAANVDGCPPPRHRDGDAQEAHNPVVQPFVNSRRNHDPRDLRSWAKRTGFVSIFSGETNASSSIAHNGAQSSDTANRDCGGNGGDNRGNSVSPKIELDPILGRTRGNGCDEVELDDAGSGLGDNKDGNERSLRFNALQRNEHQRRAGLNSGNGGERENLTENPGASTSFDAEQNLEEIDEVGVNLFAPGEEPMSGSSPRPNKIKCGVMDKPNFALLSYYSIQHYLSMAGSLVFIPVLIVPTMGGTDKDTAYVISTMLLVSGITTILHSYFGTGLPLVQGSSFVYLAPALVVMNSEDFRNLTEHKFRYIMRELQGAIIVGSVFQSIIGFSGLMSLILRWINPVVVAPTVAAVGLAFFSYGFPQAGSCVEISLPQIFLILVFTLYLRGVAISGHRIFTIHAVPLSVVIIWAYAFFLTAGGAYNYRGCNSDIPSSNILIEACKRHVYTMRHCRTDVSDALRTSLWVRIPYPLQWGIPVFHRRTSILMIPVSLIALVDSVGTYHTASLLVNSRPPTRGAVSRGIGMEGLCSILAGFWGTATGSTTLTENVHTISTTKVANRRAIQLGALFLILVSLIGKVGAILASMPQALAASVLCFMWALTVAMGLSTLTQTQASSYRNMTIVGVSMFLGLSIPAYFQQYEPKSSLILPGYLIPFSAASSGPINTGNTQIDFALNGLMSMNMVVTFFIAFVLDNTVPGTREERGIYNWSRPEDLATDSYSFRIYSFPNKLRGLFCWAKCLGV